MHPAPTQNPESWRLAYDKFIDQTLLVSEEDVRNFRERIDEKVRSIFDKEDERGQLTLVALSRLKPEELRVLSEANGGFTAVLHDARGFLTLLFFLIPQKEGN